MKLNKMLLLFFYTGIVYTCQSEYTGLVQKELATNIKNDSIFHNIRFGNTKKEFYEVCWNLNKNGIATHGPNNSYVQTILLPKDSTKTTEKISMLFYAKFSKENIIRAMDVKFSFVAWAPWNKELQSEKLIPRIIDTLLKWYPGNDFIEVKDNILVKVDGNRQIQLLRESDRDVSVIIEDLEYKYNNIKK